MIPYQRDALKSLLLQCSKSICLILRRLR